MNKEERILKYINTADELTFSGKRYYENDFYNDVENIVKENQELKKENKILRENAEHNDKVVDKVNWENQKLKYNWNKLKEWVNKHYDYYMNREDYIGGRLCFTDMKNKMHELEQGSDK